MYSSTRFTYVHCKNFEADIRIGHNPCWEHMMTHPPLIIKNVLNRQPRQELNILHEILQTKYWTSIHFNVTKKHLIHPNNTKISQEDKQSWAVQPGRLSFSRSTTCSVCTNWKCWSSNSSAVPWQEPSCVIMSWMSHWKFAVIILSLSSGRVPCTSPVVTCTRQHRPTGYGFRPRSQRFPPSQKIRSELHSRDLYENVYWKITPSKIGNNLAEHFGTIITVQPSINMQLISHYVPNCIVLTLPERIHTEVYWFVHKATASLSWHTTSYLVNIYWAPLTVLAILAFSAEAEGKETLRATRCTRNELSS